MINLLINIQNRWRSLFKNKKINLNKLNNLIGRMEELEKRLIKLQKKIDTQNKTE